MTDTRNARRTLIGKVVSTKGDKTVTVIVERTYRHPKYNKYVRKRKKYHAHDDKGEAGLGDQVQIESTRPLSKMKRWRLASIVQAAPDRGVTPQKIAEEAKADVGLEIPAAVTAEAEAGGEEAST